MSRLKQLNIERYVHKAKLKCKYKLMQWLRQTMSLHVEEKREEKCDEKHNKKTNFTSNNSEKNLKTCNRWRITMKNKSLIWILMIMVMLITGSLSGITSAVGYASDHEVYSFGVSGFYDSTLGGTNIAEAESIGYCYPGGCNAWTDAPYGRPTRTTSTVKVTDLTTGQVVAYSNVRVNEIVSAPFTAVAGHEYLVTFSNPNTEYYRRAKCQGAVSTEKNYQVGTKYYSTLEDAINGASAGNTIKVIKANTDDSNAVVNKNLTLNTNGIELAKNTTAININAGVTLNITGTGSIITQTENPMFRNDGTLNISTATLSSYAIANAVIENNENATVTINSGRITSGYIVINNYGTVNLNGGTLEIHEYTENDVYGIKTFDGSTTNISKGTIDVINWNTSYAAIAIGGTGSKNITGGSIKVEGGVAQAISTWSNSAITSSVKVSGTPVITVLSTNANGNAKAISVKGESVTLNVPIEISGGTLTASATITTNARGIESISNAGTTKITGGTITAGGYGAYIDSNAGRLSYGDSSQAISTTNPSLTGGTKGLYAPGGFDFNSGVIRGTDTTPYYGTPTPRVGNYQVVVLEPTNNMYEAVISTPRNYQVGNNYYQTLQEAISVAKPGNTIKVLKNISDSTDAIIDKNLIIDTNGFTLTKTGTSIIVNAGYTLNIIGNGTIKASDMITISNNGLFILKDATIENTTKSDLYATIANSASGTVTINSGIVRAKGSTIYNNGMLNINGGLIEATSDTEGNFNELYVRGITLNGNGSLKMTGGKISAYNSSKGVRTIEAYNNGNISISGGEITASGAGLSGIYALVLHINSGNIAGKLNISGGAKITATNESATEGGAVALITALDNNATLDYDINISDATLNATGYYSRGIALENNAGDLTITSGTIHGDNYGVSIGNVTGTINIGDSSNAISTTTPEISGGTVGINTSGSYNFYDGVIKGTNATPYSGTPTLLIGNEISTRGPSNNLYSATVIVGANYAVNGTTYSTLKAAIDAAPAGSTITVLKSHTDVTNAVVNKNITLNTNGVTLTKNTYPITVNSGCTLNVIGSGEIVGGTGISTINNNGVLSIRNATIRCTAINNSYFAIDNASSGSIVINSGSIIAKGIAINSSGTIIINGGLVEGTSDNEGNFDALLPRGIYCHGGKITISGGTVRAYNRTYGVRSIDIVGSADMNITGGKIIGEGTGTSGIIAISVWAGNGALTSKINIGGNAEIVANDTGNSTKSRCIELSNSNSNVLDCDLNISGAKIIASGTNTNAIYVATNAGDLNITGGTIQAETTAILINSTTGKVNIGNANDELNKLNPEISGGQYGISTTGSFNFYNGIIKGTNETPYSGTAVLRSNLYSLETTGPDVSNLYSTYMVFTAKYQNQDTKQYYNTLADAFNNASSGNTIKVIEDASESTKARISAEKTINLDLNGKTITVDGISGEFLLNDGTLIIDDTSANKSGLMQTKVNPSVPLHYVILSNGNLTLNAGTIMHNGRPDNYWYTVVSYGTFTMNGGLVKQNGNDLPNHNGRAVYIYKNLFTMNGGTIEGEYGYALIAFTEDPVTININDGTIKYTNNREDDHAIDIGGGTTATLNIKGGTIYGIDLWGSATSITANITGGTIIKDNAPAIINNCANGIVNIGSTDYDVYSKIPMIQGLTIAIESGNGFNFYSGILRGSDAIPYTGTPTPRDGYMVRTRTMQDGINEAYLGLKNPTITTKLVNSQGEEYSSDAYINKSVFVELTIAQAEILYKYEWSTNPDSGFTSNNLITFGGKGRIVFDDEMNGTVYFRGIDVNGNYTDTVSTVIKIDKTAPTVMAEIEAEYDDGYNEFTGNRTVNIMVDAADNCTSTENMKITFINEEDFNIETQNSNLVWTTLGTEKTKTWELSAESGLKQVYVIVKDEAGNQSAYLAKE